MSLTISAKCNKCKDKYISANTSQRNLTDQVAELVAAGWHITTEMVFALCPVCKAGYEAEKEKLRETTGREPNPYVVLRSYLGFTDAAGTPNVAPAPKVGV